MSKLTLLTSKSGESEWPYKGKTVIAVIGTKEWCTECIAITDKGDNEKNCLKLPNCTADFEKWVVFIEKPAES